MKNNSNYLIINSLNEIEVEILPLSVIDLNMRYMIKFKKPIETTVFEANFSPRYDYLMAKNRNECPINATIKRIWKQDVFWTVLNMVNPITEHQRLTMKQLYEIDNIKYREVDFNEWK